MILKKTLFFTILFTATISCGQVNNKTEITEKTMSAIRQEITAENVVDKMTNEIKRFSYEPQYYLRINKNYCLVEILVNYL